MSEVADLQRRVAALADQDARKREGLRQRLRGEAPELAAFVDDLRAAGFADARVVYVRLPSGEEHGRRRDPIVPARWIGNAALIRWVAEGKRAAKAK